jgi:hypothetical protein
MTWSYSRLNSWWTCRIAWHKNYIEKDKDRLDNFFSSFGLFCEDLIQQVDEGNISADEVLTFYEDNFAVAVPEQTIYMSRGDNMPPLNMKEFYYLAAHNFFSNFKGFDEPTISFQEKVEIVLPNGDDFIGYIDRIAGTPDKYKIIDFKSKGQFKTQKEKREYAKQLFLYSEYTIEKFGKPPEMMYFHLFRSYGKKNRDGTRRDVVEIPWNKKQYKEALKWRDETIEDIKKTALSNENWKPENKNPDFFYCHHLCSFSHNCEVHKKLNKDKIEVYNSLHKTSCPENGNYKPTKQ